MKISATLMISTGTIPEVNMSMATTNQGGLCLMDLQATTTRGYPAVRGERGGRL